MDVTKSINVILELVDEIQLYSEDIKLKEIHLEISEWTSPTQWLDRELSVIVGQPAGDAC